MGVSSWIITSIPDGDSHMKISNVNYSTSPREIVTVGYMIEHPIKDDENETIA